MLDLAQTVWPRFGGDRANRSLLSVPGPHTLPTWKKVSLKAFCATRSLEVPDGVIVMPDETLRVCHAGMLFAVRLDGTILWHLDLSRLISEDTYRTSLPAALQNGVIFLQLRDSLLMVDKSGEVCRRDYLVTAGDTESPTSLDVLPDDSGFSPNLTYNGLPILSAITGEVCVFNENQWRQIGGLYGYDIVTPAVYPDNSLAIAGYYGQGFCRVSLEGEIQWTTHLRYADLLPTLNLEQIAAVGSLKDNHSAFFITNGEQIGEYHHPATFAAYPDGGWIALSKQSLARLTLEGKALWACEICRGDNYSFVEQPIVDIDGFIFIRQKESILCCDPHGQKAFEVKLPVPSQGLISIVSPRVMAYVLENELFLGYS